MTKWIIVSVLLLALFVELSTQRAVPYQSTCKLGSKTCSVTDSVLSIPRKISTFFKDFLLRIKCLYTDENFYHVKSVRRFFDKVLDPITKNLGYFTCKNCTGPAFLFGDMYKVTKDFYHFRKSAAMMTVIPKPSKVKDDMEIRCST